MPSNYVRRWARAVNGVVVEIAKGPHEDGHPFGKLSDNERAVDVSKIECWLGYHVDAKGNVAPIPGRTEPLAEGETAYHDRMNPPAHSTSERVQKLNTAEPHPLSVPSAPNKPEADEDLA